MLVAFSLTHMFHHVWERKCLMREWVPFLWCSFLETALNLWIFTHALVPQSKLQVEFFENLFPPRRKEWRKLWFALLKSLTKKYIEILPWISCQLRIISVFSLSAVLPVYYRAITMNFYCKKKRVLLNLTKSH